MHFRNTAVMRGSLSLLFLASLLIARSVHAQTTASATEVAVSGLYQDIFGREPDASSLSTWLGAVQSGSSLANVARAQFHSSEFQLLSEAQKIRALYRVVLRRDPDSSGAEQWTRALHTGEQSLFDIASIFVQSSEFRTLDASTAEYVRTTLGMPGILNSETHNNSAENRKKYFREVIVRRARDGLSPMPILAYEGVPIRDEDLDLAIEKLLNDETGDFRLAQLVRVLFFAPEYRERLLGAMSGLDYWLTPNEDQYCYWSENHMILWMSSSYLMRQLEGIKMDANLDRRLTHYLDLKLQHGFYEFFSTTYLPFTLAALLNLSDFAEDSAIRSKATVAAKRLMQNWLLVTNDKGATYSAAGRNYSSRYEAFEPSTIPWMTAKLGPMRTNTDYVGAFLATSAIDLRDVATSFRSSVDTTFTFGHDQEDHAAIHAGQSRVDRTIFQWSSGGYFHPEVADDTTWLVDSYNLENNHHFDIFRSLPDLPDSWSNGVAKLGATFSRSSSISGARVRIYKNEGVTLTSISDYFPGYRGYQQWPWAAAVDDIAVWTQSGEIGPDWTPGNSTSANSHLPKVQQDGNVALITYFPNLEIRALQMLGRYETTVSLYWPKERFDESFEWNRWLVGRKGNSYIAVLRDAVTMCNGVPCSHADRGRQMWAVVVGNKTTHGSFSRFVDVIKAASIKETYEFDFRRGERVYFTRIQVDGKYIRNWW